MGCLVIFLNLASGSLNAEASNTFLTMLFFCFLPVVGVLRQKAVHEQKSVRSWTVIDSGPVYILHLQDGWMDFRGFFWGVYFCVAKMILYSWSFRICLQLSGC